MTDEELDGLWKELSRITGATGRDYGYSVSVGSVAGRYAAEIKRLRPMEEKLERIREIVGSDKPAHVQIIRLKRELEDVK